MHYFCFEYEYPNPVHATRRVVIVILPFKLVDWNKYSIQGNVNKHVNK